MNELLLLAAQTGASPADLKVWAYVGFIALVVFFLALDLGVFHREAHEVSMVASMKYVALLATVLFNVYAVMGVKLFGVPGDPMQPYLASIHETCFTLFRILTGDDCPQMRYEVAQAGHPLLAFTVFQVSWILVATFLLVNLIVGAVINNYQRVQEIEHGRALAPDPSEARVRELRIELQAILESKSAGPPSPAANPTAEPSR